MLTTILACAVVLATFALSIPLLRARAEIGRVRTEHAAREADAADEAAKRDALLVEAQAEAAKQRQRADSYFEMLDGIVGEATTVRELYQTMAVRHGNAQALMMNQISSLHRQYLQLVEEFKSATGKLPRRPKPAVDPRIDAVAREYQEEHIDRPLEMPRTSEAEQTQAP